MCITDEEALVSDETDAGVKTATGPIGDELGLTKGDTRTTGEGPTVATARVGQVAPDFETSAYVASEGFKNIKLSDYRGQWVVLCFYPGDFTFV